MNPSKRSASSGFLTHPTFRTDGFRLQALIDEATTDSTDESDEHVGMLGMVREEVACPFRARLHGEDVECLRLTWPERGYGVEAVCRTARGKVRTAEVAELEFVDPLPKGYPWIEAYLAWRARLG